MIRKSFTLLALALVAAAVAAPIAQSSSAPKVDPLAVGYLIGQGLYPERSHVLDGGRLLAPGQGRLVLRDVPSATSVAASKPVDPLAVGYLTGQGLSPSQVTSWTTGACSQQVKDASCYAMFQSRGESSTQITRSTGFQWGDAGIGAGFTLGIVLLLGGAGAGLLISRRNAPPQAARA